MTKQILPLVIRTIAGDHEAFEQLLHSQKSIIRFLICRRTVCPEDVEDIHQEVSLRIFQYIATLKRPEAFSSWLSAIVTRECMRHFESQKRFVSVETADEDDTLCVETDSDCIPSARMEKLELCAALDSAIDSLKEPLRRIFYMRYGIGMCCGDIAAVTGLKTGTVSVKMFRARAQLWERLSACCIEI